jgi:hypothetical protein
MNSEFFKCSSRKFKIAFLWKLLALSKGRTFWFLIIRTPSPSPIFGVIKNKKIKDSIDLLIMKTFRDYKNTQIATHEMRKKKEAEKLYS